MKNLLGNILYLSLWVIVGWIIIRSSQKKSELYTPPLRDYQIHVDTSGIYIYDGNDMIGGRIWDTAGTHSIDSIIMNDNW